MSLSSTAVCTLTLAFLFSLLYLPCLCRELSKNVTNSCKDTFPSEVGLTAAKPDSRPWMALIWVSCEKLVSQVDNSTQLLIKTCEGALVRESWVLTASTCLQECRDIRQVSATVDIGLHSSDIREEFAANRRNERISVQKIYSSEDVVAFEYSRDLTKEYFSVNSSAYNDIVLLLLSRRVRDHSRIIPLVDCTKQFTTPSKLQQSFNYLSGELGGSGNGGEESASGDSHDDFEGSGTADGSSERASEGGECLVSSWGGPMSERGGVLQDMKLRLLPRGECDHIVKGLLCVSNSSGHLTSTVKMMDWFRPDCVVQQGSPLVIYDEDVVKCGPRLLGLFAFGMGCHEYTQSEKTDANHHLTTPGLFADVCPHLSWIETTIAEDEALTTATSACPVLPLPPPNGYICNRGETTSLHVEVCCERGYKLEGRAVYECNRSKRRWEPAVGPKCVSITCPPLLAPSNGHTHPDGCTNASYQTTCWVLCDLGYTLSHGDGLLTCTADGVWSTPLPNCIPVDCSLPPSAGSLMVTYSSTFFNSTAIYTCSHCHKMVGGASESVMVVCDGNGKWRGPKPTCAPVTCPPINSPSSGSAHFSSLQCGAQVYYSCQPGMNLIGQSEAKCLSNGTWSALTPQCTPLACEAPKIAGSNFAGSNASYSFGSVISVECDRCRVRMVEGVRNLEEGTLTCTRNGKWDGLIPTCQWVTCPLPSFLDNGTIEPLGQLYFCGTTVKFSCDQGYQLNGTETNTSTCTQNGTWTEKFPTCEEIPVDYCLPPPSPQNHTHFCRPKVTQYLHSVVSYCCDDGYQFVGGVRVGTVRCEESGDWNGTVRECEPITCSSPTLPTGVVISRVQLGYTQGREFDYGHTSSNAYFYGTRLTLACVDIVHSVRGQRHLTCGEEGQWDHPPPTCEDTSCSVACELPHPPRNGRIISIIRPGVGIIPQISQLEESGTLIGDVAVFICNQGYYLHGSGSRKCSSNGVWSGQAPHCLSSDQPRSQFITRNPTNTTKWETTDSTHFLSTDTIYLACQISTEGMGRALPIRKISGPLLNTRNTRTRVYGRPSRSTQMAIQPRNTAGGHSMEGVYLCQVQSTSNRSFIISKTLTVHVHDVLCPTPRPPPHGKQTTMGTIPGSCLHYKCNRGYTLIGTNDRVCLTNGTWTGDTPLCLSTYNATCSPPPPIDHAFLATSTAAGTYHLNDTVTYECDTGYTLVGRASRQCMGGDRWSEEIPMCVLETSQHGV